MASLRESIDRLQKGVEANGGSNPHPPGHQPQEEVGVQASEEVGEIGVHHPPRSGVHFLTDDLQRVESRPLGPEPERTRQEAGLEERLSCPQHLRKIEVRSRAGASLFAMENDLLHRAL